VKKSLFFLLFIAVCFCSSVLGGTTIITNCSDLNVSGETYLLAINDVDNWNAGNCFNVQADNITLDCGNHYVDGVGTNNGINIDSGLENITIQNCVVKNFNYNLYSVSNTNQTVSTSSFLDSTADNWYLSALNDGFFENIFINDSTSEGIYIQAGQQMLTCILII